MNSVPEHIPYNRPFITGRELSYIAQVHQYGMLAGDGSFTRKCHAWLERHTKSPRAFLTHSCTAALEIAALLLELDPGDEVIMPSYTFVSTANAFVLRGAVPVFVDIRPDTLNLNEKLIESAVTPRTRAIVPVHYAGVSCAMDEIMAVAQRHGVKVIEDAAQGVMAFYKGRSLGGMGDLGTFSFHETKNVTSGEGGALIINDPNLIAAAEIFREKGTDRSRFFRGQVDKYTWQTIGSSYLPGELTAAFLWAQLEEAERITKMRTNAWLRYDELIDPLASCGRVRKPVIPEECQHNAHMYYVLLPEGIDRQAVIEGLRANGIDAVFHYVPLHSSPAGLRYGRAHGALRITDSAAARIVRLPLWAEISANQQLRVVETLDRILMSGRALNH